MELRTVGLDHPDTRGLIDAVQQEYVVRYGGQDSSPVDPAESPHRRGRSWSATWTGVRSSAAAGYRDVVLETGVAQPEALELYRSCGYAPVEPFGHYPCAPLSRHYGKSLGARLP